MGTHTLGRALGIEFGKLGNFGVDAARRAGDCVGSWNSPSEVTPA